MIQWAAAALPTLVSGSADLEPSTNTEIEDGGSVTRDDFSGRNVHYGVREHGMGAIVNGLNRHGVRAFGSTFFNFLDYMKGAVRLAALMELGVIHVFTHDSIGLGEDGPTHQPVEQLAHLRATPNVNCVRPADANETALAWKFALESTEGPTALVLSRQGIPILDPDAIPADAVEKGAYVLREGDDLILIGTGAEVQVALDAADELSEKDGLSARVVSMPCWDRFAEADQSYRDEVLPPAITARVSIEAAATLGWEKWVGDAGASLGMTGFGASGAGQGTLRALRPNVRAPSRGCAAAPIGPSRRHDMAQNERLAALTDAGVAVWLDQIHRQMIESGDLKALVDEKSLRGETSNPAIFEKAIMGGDAYDDKIEQFAAEGLDARAAYLRIAIEDVQAACDVMRPVYDELDRYDGYVSLEVEPAVAHDTDATAKQAKELWEAVDRPNVMIKIPGTPEGVQAIEDATADGINVNVTLLFSVESYENIAEAYIRGMERRKEAGESPGRALGGVVLRLARGHRGGQAPGGRRQGGPDRAGGDRQRAGRLPVVQEPLPRRPVRGAEGGGRARAAAAVGLHRRQGRALRRHQVRGRAGGAGDGEHDAAGHARGVRREARGRGRHRRPGSRGDAAEAGRRRDRHGGRDPDPARRGHREVRRAVRQAHRRHRRADVQGGQTRERLVGASTAGWPRRVDEGVVRRIWDHDEVLWGGPGPEIGNRLGWLDIADRLLEEADDLAAFAAAARDDGFTHAALLGMGGSSLGPEVIRRSYGKLDGGLELHVLDSTDPGAVRALEAAIDLENTLFVVSSKSGGTVETLSHMKHFYELAGRNGDQFVAVTDPGSGLVDIAAERGFRRVFENDPNIGGRYSVMSYFGLVPAALAGRGRGAHVPLGRRGSATSAATRATPTPAWRSA